MIIGALVLLFTLDFNPDYYSTGRMAVEVQSRFEALKFTPRWTIEPFAGWQMFATSRFILYASPLCTRTVRLGLAAEILCRHHFSYFHTYGKWLVGDPRMQFAKNVGKDLYLVQDLAIPIGRYEYPLLNGVPRYRIAVTKQIRAGHYGLRLSYEWRGQNLEKTEFGDCFGAAIAFGACCIGADFEFPDRNLNYECYDTPSISLAFTATKTLKSTRHHRFKIVLSQKVLGRDVSAETCLALLALQN